MKLYVTSDIHLEFGDCVIENQDNVDVLILSGDIMHAQVMHDYPDPSLGRAQTFRDFLKRCSSQFPHVIYVAGNHEFYNGNWPKGIEYLREECAKFSNVYFMENDCKVIDDFTFVGCTLWTNMNRGDPLTLYHVARMMNDYRVIRNSDHGFRRLTPEDTALHHRTSLGYIKTIIEGTVDQKFIVVGHMLPSKQSTHPKYKEDTLMNGAFSSDLDDFILDHPQIKLWTHGHTHEDFDYMVGSTRIVCNPRGYINYEERANTWQPKLVDV
jgi:predicted phosphodiesterase